MSSGDCVFCRIATGAIPARTVLDTAECLGFLDAAPLAPGHCLVIPKQHFEAFADMPAAVAGAMLGHLPALGRAVLAATGAGGFNVLINNGQPAGQEVMHVHAHIIPRRSGDELGYRWRPQGIEDAEADALRERIEGLLNG
jgi:histidine triad (HIT) family protein